MKKIIALAFCLSLIGVSANAQDFQLGLKGGVNFASLSSDDFNYESNTGYNAGLFLKLKFTKIAIQPEIMWSVQGASLTEDTGILGLAESTYKYSYVNIPILLKLYLVSGINVFIGPQFGFLSAADLKVEVAGISTEQDIKEFVSGADVTGVIGVGIDLPAGLHADFRYNVGITDVELDFGTGTVEAQKNSVFQLGIGWAFLRK